MNMHETFNFNRLSKLIINDFRLHAKNILIVGAALIVLLALLPFHLASSPMTYVIVLYIGGFIISSFAFTDYHDPRKAFFYLTLPCSNLERFLNRWLLTSILYALGLLAIFYLFSAVSFIANNVFYHQASQILDISQSNLWIEIGKYIIFQAIILLGAIIFRKYALVKTALAIGCFFLALSLLSVMAAWIFCPTCFLHGISFHFNTNNIPFVFWICTAPFLWIITYLRLTKIELR